MNQTVQIWGIIAPSAIAILSIVLTLFLWIYNRKDTKESVRIAREALALAKSQAEYERQPRLMLTQLYLDPTKVEVFGSDKLGLEKSAPLPPKYLELIRSFEGVNRSTHFGSNNYVLINMVKEKHLDDNIGLLLGVLDFKIEWKDPDITHIEVIEAYSLIEDDKSFATDTTLDINNNVAGATEIKVSMAYAFSQGLDTSINLHRVAQIHDKETDIIHLVNSKEKTAEERTRAGDIICFIETAYLLRCKTSSSNEEFNYTLCIDRDMSKVGAGKLNDAYIQSGEKLFRQKAENACERVGKNVVIKKRDARQQNMPKE